MSAPKLTSRIHMIDHDGLVYDLNRSVWLDEWNSQPVWLTKDERQVKLCDMETSHIRHCISLIAERALRGKSWRTGYLPLLAAELANREVKPGLTNGEDHD